SLVGFYKRLNRIPGDHSPALLAISGQLRDAMQIAGKAVHSNSRLGEAMRDMSADFSRITSADPLESLRWRDFAFAVDWGFKSGVLSPEFLGRSFLAAGAAVSVSLFTYFIAADFFSMEPRHLMKLSALVGGGVLIFLRQYLDPKGPAREPPVVTQSEPLQQLRDFAAQSSSHREGEEVLAMRKKFQFLAIVDPEGLPPSLHGEQRPGRNENEIQDDPEPEDVEGPDREPLTEVRVGDLETEEMVQEEVEMEVPPQRSNSRRRTDRDEDPPG
ncbi:MAG TPA: hypothetical protein VFW62_09785, partial [bacterium]|nr:hypothetical protein [bacterium]